LEVEVDGVPVDALSLHAFRRLPWPAALAPVAVDRALAQQVEDAGLTAATTLAIDQKRRD
jgi:phosphoribosylcarboxyaminoimidazole (NCAIR) mutase